MRVWVVFSIDARDKHKELVKIHKTLANAEETAEEYTVAHRQACHIELFEVED